MRIQNNVSLKRFNTYKVDVKAKYFVRIKDVEEIKALIKKYEYKSSKDVMVLGGGSNTLFTKNFDGMIIKNEILGRKIFKEDAKSMLIEFGAGEIWDDVVKYCVNKNLGGIENMAYIPGTIGGAATGNIAAYDQNLETVFHSLIAINKKIGVLKKFLKKDCGFGYRDSLFKKENNVWIITNVILKLNKNPILDVNYYEKGLAKTSIQAELELIAKPPYKLIDVYNAVVSLRKKRIPSEKEFPNVGSFFRNPIISKAKYLKIKKEIPNLQFYPVEQLRYISNDKIYSTKVKVGYGQLIDQGLGLKGFKRGNVGIHQKHAAFIYSNGKATGQQILKFSQFIKNEIYKKYKIKLEAEVKIY